MDKDFLQRFEKANTCIKQVSAVGGKKIKESILSSYDDSDFLKQILLYTYNPYYIYGVSKKSINNTQELSSGLPQSQFSDIFQLLEYLRVNNTGKAMYATEANMFLSALPKANFEFGKNIILRDLRCGINIETINKVFSKLIPKFKVQLCEPLESESQLESTCGCVMVQPKLDGVRCIAMVYNNGAVELYTRNGSLLEGYDEIEDQLSNNKNLYGYVLDGEIMGKNFDNTMEGLFAKDIMKDAVYTIFDIVELRDFNSRNCNETYYDRFQELMEVFDPINTAGKSYDKLKVISGTYLYDQDITIENISKLLDLEISRGYEGVVVKDMQSFYEFKRSKNWLKFKKMITEEFEIVDMEIGQGKYSHTLGALVVDVNGVNVKVGSGFTDEQRDYLWDNNVDILGETAEIKYQEKTKDGSLRFPVFVKIRNDK